MGVHAAPRTCADTGNRYGGGFGTIPALLADQFSAQNTGATHGYVPDGAALPRRADEWLAGHRMVLTAWATAGVIGGLTFAAVFDAESARLGVKSLHVYDANFRWILAVIVLSLIVSAVILTNIRDRKLPYDPNEVLRLRIPGGRLVRFYSNAWPRIVPKAEEDKQWNAWVSSLHQGKAGQLPIVHVNIEG